MDYGSVLGHRAYLGPDYTADTLHLTTEAMRRERTTGFAALGVGQKAAIDVEVAQELRTNPYDSVAVTQEQEEKRTGGGQLTELRSTPTPSSSTSTRAPGDIFRVLPGVPVYTKSPGNSVTHPLIQLSTVGMAKIRSLVNCFWTVSPLMRVWSSSFP